MPAYYKHAFCERIMMSIA